MPQKHIPQTTLIATSTTNSYTQHQQQARLDKPSYQFNWLFPCPKSKTPTLISELQLIAKLARLAPIPRGNFTDNQTSPSEHHVRCNLNDIKLYVNYLKYWSIFIMSDVVITYNHPEITKG